MNPNDVQWMTLSELQAITTGSVDFGDYDDSADLWGAILRKKTRDTGFGWLAEDMAVRGWLEACPIPVDEDGEIMEAHHRLAAAILLCLDRIPVVRGGYCSENRSLGPDAHSYRANWGNPAYVFDSPYPIVLD